jgi:hypothetical protein
MASASLESVWKEVEALPPDEQREISERLETLLESPARQPTEAEFEQHLVRVGLLSRVRPPVDASAEFESWKPVDALGKPVSETLIEERV